MRESHTWQASNEWVILPAGNLRTRGSERLSEYVLKFFATFWHQKVDYKFKFKLTESTTVRNTENFKEEIIKYLRFFNVFATLWLFRGITNAQLILLRIANPKHHLNNWLLLVSSICFVLNWWHKLNAPHAVRSTSVLRVTNCCLCHRFVLC